MGFLSLFSGLSYVKWIAIGVGILAIAAGTAWATHQIDLASYEKLELSYAAAETKAIQQAKTEQAAQDQVILNSALKEAQNQQDLLTKKLNIQKEVAQHVKNKPTDCIPYGAIRLLDAFILGVDPNTLKLAAGQSDGTCSPITATDMVQSIINNYSISQQNAEQLNALEDSVRQIFSTVQKPVK